MRFKEYGVSAFSFTEHRFAKLFALVERNDDTRFDFLWLQQELKRIALAAILILSYEYLWLPIKNHPLPLPHSITYLIYITVQKKKVKAIELLEPPKSCFEHREWNLKRKKKILSKIAVGSRIGCYGIMSDYRITLFLLIPRH